MAYGISVTGKDTAGNPFYVIDSTTVKTEFLVPTAGGVKTASGDNRASVEAYVSSPSSISGQSADTLLFARPHDNINYMYFHTQQALQSTYFVITKPNSLLTATSDLNGESYGWQVNNSAGTPIQIMDSRKVQKGVSILRGLEREALTGGDYSTSSSYQATACVWDGSSQTALEFANTYVTVNTTFYVDNGQTRTVLGGYYFDHSIRKIYHVAYISVSGGGSYQGSSIKNLGDILVGELKQ